MNISPINILNSFKGKLCMLDSKYSCSGDKPREIDVDKIVEINKKNVFYKDSDNSIKSYPFKDSFGEGSSLNDEQYTRFLAAYTAAKVAGPDVVIWA